ncbi:MAG: AMP-binding protein [Myxococcota bacterium]
MTILRSSRPRLEFAGVSITEFALRHAARLAERTAFVDGPSGRTLSYGEFASRVKTLAGGLAAAGVGPGTTWALMAPNSPEYAVIFHALAYTGACVTTLNPTYGVREIVHQLKDGGATTLVAASMFGESAAQAAKDAGISLELFEGAEGEFWTKYAGEPLAAQVSVNLDEHVVALPYSSGTTGFPKGVMLTHTNLVVNVQQFGAHLTVDEGEVCFAVLPFFHIYGMQVLMNFMLATGCTVVTAPRFDMVQMLELTQQWKITRLFLVPPIVLALAKHPIVDQYNLESVREIFSGAAPLGGDVAEAAANRLGCSVAQGYGMTELSPVTHAIATGDYRAGSVGTLVANTEARLVMDGTDVGSGERGELWVRGPQVMKGYLNNEEATAQTIDADGWLHTGDVAVVDEDGHTFIVDRMKELIKVKGFQVAPAELEALLLGHAGIADAAVIGVPDEAAGERVKAFVVRADESLNEAAIKAYVAEHVATYKELSLVEFVDAIPKSASGKILRRELRERENAAG